MHTPYFESHRKSAEIKVKIWIENSSVFLKFWFSGNDIGVIFNLTVAFSLKNTNKCANFHCIYRPKLRFTERLPSIKGLKEGTFCWIWKAYRYTDQTVNTNITNKDERLNLSTSILWVTLPRMCFLVGVTVLVLSRVWLWNLCGYP